MNFFTAGAKFTKRVAAVARQCEKCGMTSDEAHEAADRMTVNEFREYMKNGIRLQQIYMEEAGFADGRWYFVTVRPPDSVAFNEFYTTAQRLLQRGCFLEWQASFEQKGTSEDTLGTGCHIHIVARMNQRSKGEVVRDVASTFKDLCDKNYVDVVVTKNPKDLVQNYLIDYKSKDEHKEVTKDWDRRWRSTLGLQDLYTDCMPSVRIQEELMT